SADPRRLRPGRPIASGSMVKAVLRPRGPYSLRVSARHGDATRSLFDGVYRATIRPAGDAIERVRAWQRSDGAVVVEADTEPGVEHVRFVLGLEDDHSEFVTRFAGDPLLG